MSTIELVPIGKDAWDVHAGDFILCNRAGIVPAMIRLGQRARQPKQAQWSHAAYVVSPRMVIEALTSGVRATPLKRFRSVEYAIVRTGLDPLDAQQASAFAASCLNQRYGWPTILGIGLRFLTPGRGLWFGADGTEICSSLVAQALCRGWANFRVNPGSITPAELAEAYGA